MHADVVKHVHQLRQFTIVKLASCMTHLNLLDCEAQELCTRVAQTSANLEALGKRVATSEDMLVNAGLREIRVGLQKTNEEIATLGESGRRQLLVGRI